MSRYVNKRTNELLMDPFSGTNNPVGAKDSADVLIIGAVIDGK